jgi:hypothetical protein
MMDWSTMSEWIAIGVMLILSLYVLIHMMVNRIRGKDEVEGLFVFRRRKK